MGVETSGNIVAPATAGRKTVARAHGYPKTGSVTGLVCGEFLIELSDDISAFARDWPRLADLGSSTAAAHPFQCRDHLHVWLETIGAASGVRPVMARVSDRRGDPAMLLPLGITRRAGIRVLGFLDAGVADYNAPILYPAASSVSPPEMKTLWAALCHAAPNFDVAMLDKMPEVVRGRHNPLCTLASEPWSASGHVLELVPGSSLASLQRRREKNDSARQRRRLSEIGKLEFRAARGEPEIVRVFEAFVRQKSRRYRETLGKEGFDVPAQLDYYLELTQRFGGQGVELWHLDVAGEPIATAWGFEDRSCLYYMMCAYEAGEWRKFSPGRLLLEELIDWSCRNGVRTFDFGIGDEEYKLAWPQRNVPLWRAIGPRTFAGHAVCAAIGLRRALKNHLPPELVRAAKKCLGR